jgi:hypothetical protein
VTDSGQRAGDAANATYRFAADEQTAAWTARSLLLQALRTKVLWIVLVGVSLSYGVVASLVVNAASLPYYRTRVLLIGLFWGAITLVFSLLVLLVVLLIGQVINRRHLRGLYPAGTVIEAELGDDSLTVRRNTGTVVLPYATIGKVRVGPRLVRVSRRGQWLAEMLPREMFSHDALDTLRIRAGSGRRATMITIDDGTHHWVAPAGWAAHAAGVSTANTLRDRRFWFRVGLMVVISATVALWLGWYWILIAAPVLLAVLLGTTYLMSRRAIGTALPEGATATTEFHDDRLVSRNPMGVREIRYDDIIALRLVGDVVCLRLRSQPRAWLLMARPLFPDDRLEAMRTPR